MSEVILKIENLSKQYRLGTVGTGTISHDLNRWWHKIRGKEDPFLKVGEVNDRATKGNSEYVWALKDINFEVKKGEVLGIIGKNGAGKSTLLKILSKVTGPTTGSIKSKGRIASLLEVGTGFHPELTGRENIYLNGAILGMSKAEINSKIDEIVEFSGCERYIDTPVKRYSSGMTVRLAFSVAAHLEPDILVIDEVLAVGDAEFQKKAIGKMQDISKGEGRTVLFVSHDMTAIRNLCSRVLHIENGRIKEDGNSDFVISNYLIEENEIRWEVNLEIIPRKSKSCILKRIIIQPNKKKIISGSELCFRVFFDDKQIKELTLGYVIKNELNQIVHAANMYQYKKKITVINGKNYIDVLLINLPLNPGKYSLSLYLGNGKHDIDILRDVVHFYVFWDELLGINPPIKKFGPVFLYTDWKY